MIKKYSFLIGFLFLILIVYQIDLRIFYSTFKAINYQILIPAFFLVVPLILIKACRWNYLKRLQGIHYKIKDSFLMYGVGMTIGSLTPCRLGEICKVNYLKKDGYSTGQSLISIIIDRFLDIFFLTVLGYLGIIFFFGFFGKITLIYSIIILSIIICFFIIKNRIHNKLIKKIFLSIIPLKHQNSLQINFQSFLNGISVYNKKNFLVIFLITFLTWLIYYFQIFLFAKSIGLNNISFLYLIMAINVSSFITLLPISFLGIGTREATLIILFLPLAIAPELTIVLSELILLNFVILGIIGAISWWIKPLPLINIFKK